MSGRLARVRIQTVLIGNGAGRAYHPRTPPTIGVVVLWQHADEAYAFQLPEALVLSGSAVEKLVNCNLLEARSR